MPELPEVETIKRAMSNALTSAQIIDVKITNRQFREKVPDNFEKDVIGSKILSFERIAKYVTINLDNGVTIIWHLGMSGRIKILDEMPKNIEKHDHIIIKTNKEFLIYNDARRFGLVTCCKTSELMDHHLIKNIGLDPFNKDLNETYLFNKLQKKKNAIKVSLLDQTIVNGIGNIYASEILFLCKILPLRVSNKITIDECKSIIEATRIVLNKAIQAGGSTLKDYKKPDGDIGYFQNSHCVYNKTGKKCDNCTCDIAKTGGIQKIVQAGRSTFYCKTKQK